MSEHVPSIKKHGLMDWLTTVDHKKIAIMYLATGAIYLVIGGIFALLMRLQLAVPNNTLFVGSDFNQLLTMHGIVMIFFVATPVIFGFWNAIIPLQVGARDVAYPFLNALGFWLFFFGALLVNISWFFGGAPEGGWTIYAPLALSQYTGTGTDFLVLGLQLSGAGTIMNGINFLATIINMRAPGLSMLRLPMFTWTSIVVSVLILFAFPPLTIALFLIFFDRIFGTNFFNVAAGGDPVIYEHLFWIFGHPEVYILVLPAFGILSEILPVFSRKPLFGYHGMVIATSTIGLLGMMVWVHHMFTVGLGPIANSIFGIATSAIAVPTGIKVFTWIFTMWRGKIRFTTSMLYAASVIPNFVFAGVTGVMLALPPGDFQFHDTYFVVGHFHYVILGGIVASLIAAAYYWWPIIFNRQLNEKVGKINFWFYQIGFALTFLVQHWMGPLGMPRRVFTYEGGRGLDTINMISTIGAFLMSVSVLVIVLSIVHAWFKGKPTQSDPWDARTLEWSIKLPVPEYNFAQTPRVRARDAFWYEKMAGNKEMVPAEPLGEIHMPSPSILPFIMSVGFFIASFGFIFHLLPITLAGFAIAGVCMVIRSFKDDHGYHVNPNELSEGV